MLGRWAGHRKDTTVDGKGTAYLHQRGDDSSYRKAAAFLDGGPVEDWGCGTCYARQFFTHPYTGVDGTGDYADKVADLRDYTSQTHGILLRHVLEHNLEWKDILRNALASCNKLAIVLFTPLAAETQLIRMDKVVGVPVLSLGKNELTAMLPSYKEEVIGGETMFYVTVRECTES